MNEQTEEERQKALLAAQEIETRLFRLTTVALEYNAAEARHNREQSPESWKNKEEIGKMYLQENQWFSDHKLLPQWDMESRKFTKAVPMSDG